MLARASVGTIGLMTKVPTRFTFSTDDQRQVKPILAPLSSERRSSFPQKRDSSNSVRVTRCLRVGGVVLRWLRSHVAQPFHKVNVLHVVAHKLTPLRD